MHYVHERNYGCRVKDELTYRGLLIMTLENKLLRISVLLDQGTDIFEFLHKPTDTDFMWHSPTGVRGAASAPPSSYLESGCVMVFYVGGWQELVPHRGG